MAPDTLSEKVVTRYVGYAALPIIQDMKGLLIGGLFSAVRSDKYNYSHAIAFQTQCNKAVPLQLLTLSYSIT